MRPSSLHQHQVIWGFIITLLLFVQPIWASNEIIEKLQSLPQVSDVKPIESDFYKDKFTMFITQDVDAKNPNVGKFKQRVIV